jgi:hypothetical protein
VKRLLLLLGALLAGCAAAIQPLPVQNVAPVQAQFGLRFTHADTTIPLQGAVSMAEHEGSLGVIFPHGRTLGVCLYRQDGMECTPAGEDTLGMRFMLQSIGRAVYRLLPDLAQGAREHAPDAGQDVAETDWSVHWLEVDAGRRAEYRDLDGNVILDLRFTEIVRP